MELSNGNRWNAVLFSILLMALSLTGCLQREGLPASGENSYADQHLPFAGASDKGGIFPTGSLIPTAIPAGTPVAVHLLAPLSSATAKAGDSFEAVLDEPIIVRGHIVAPSGSSVTGKVLDARAAGEFQEPGYMRLALIAVSLNGQSLPIQTSSIFVKRGSHQRRDQTLVNGTPMDAGSISKTSMGGASMNAASMNGASISEASMRKSSTGKASLSKATTASLTRSVRGTIVEASTGTAAGLETGSDPEPRDAGVAPDRRLTFRLAQPIPLGM